MSKVFNFMVILTGLLLLLALAGFPTATNGVLGAIGWTVDTGSDGTPSGISPPSALLSTLFFVSLLGIFIASAALGGGITIGAIGVSAPDSKFVAVIMSALFTWVCLDLASVIRVTSSFGQTWITVVTSLLIVPLIVGFAIAAIGFWRGSDA